MHYPLPTSPDAFRLLPKNVPSKMEPSSRIRRANIFISQRELNSTQLNETLVI